MKLIGLATLIALHSYAIVTAQVVKNFTLQDIDNEKVNLYDLQGESITVIDFWTTWCKPCKKAIPELNKIYTDYKDKGVQIIGVNCDGPRTIAQVPGVSNAMQIRYPVLLDINSDVPNSLNIGSFPTLIIIDSKHRIKYFHEGFVPGDEEEIIGAIDKLLNK